MNKHIVIFGLDETFDKNEIHATKLNQDTGDTISIHFYNGIGIPPYFIMDTDDKPKMFEGINKEDIIFYHLVPKFGAKTIVKMNGSLDKFYDLNQSSFSVMDASTSITEQANYDKTEDEIVDYIMSQHVYSNLLGVKEFTRKYISASRACDAYQNLLQKSVEKFGYNTENKTIKVNGSIKETIHGMQKFLHGDVTRVFTVDDTIANMFSELCFKAPCNRRSVRERDFDSLVNDINVYPDIQMLVTTSPYSDHILFRLRDQVQHPEKIYIDPNLISNREKRFNEA